MSEIKHTLFRRKGRDNRFVLSYVPPGGSWRKPKQITAPSDVRNQTQAKAWCARKLEELRRSGGDLERRRPGEVSLRECHERLMAVREAHPDTKRSTIENNKTHLKAQILADELREANGRIADVPMADVDVALARKFVRGVRARVSPNHCRNIVSTMRVLWDVAIAENIIRTANPFRNELTIGELPKQRNTRALTVDGQPVTLPLSAVQAVIDADDELVPLAFRVRLLLAVTSGLDDGEIAGLTWGAVGERARVRFVAVRQALATRGRKGNATVDTTKTENRVREVPLHPEASRALEAWREAWQRLTCRKPRDADFVFVAVSGGRKAERRIYPYRPKSAEQLRASLRAVNEREVGQGRAALVREADLGRVTFKATRRTFSSALKNADVSREDRGRLMGHSGETVTERNYTAHELGRLAGLVVRIPLLWGTVQVAVGTAPNDAQMGSRRAPDSSHMSEGYAEPPSRFELETYGLRSESAAVQAPQPIAADTDDPPRSHAASNGTEGSNGLGSDPGPDLCTAAPCAPDSPADFESAASDPGESEPPPLPGDRASRQRLKSAFPQPSPGSSAPRRGPSARVRSVAGSDAEPTSADAGAHVERPGPARARLPRETAPEARPLVAAAHGLAVQRAAWDDFDALERAVLEDDAAPSSTGGGGRS